MFLTRLPEPVSTTYVPYRGVCVRTKGVKRYPVDRCWTNRQKAREKDRTETSVVVA